MTTGRGTTTVALLTTLAAPPFVTEGCTDPVGGWVSPRYGELVAAPQLRYPLDPDIREAAFVLATSSEAAPQAVQWEVVSDSALGIRVTTLAGDDFLLINRTVNLDYPLVFEGMQFYGRVLWLQTRNDQVMRFRWLDGSRIDWPRQDLHMDLSPGAGELICSP